MRLIDADALKDEIQKELNKADLSEYEACICVTSIYDRLIDNAPTVELPDFKAGYKQAILDGKAQYQRPKGECEKCDFRKFTETFVDGVVDLMNKNDITSVEQLSEILKGGAE